MLKSLLTLGAITGFIASAFVPPTDANMWTLHEVAKVRLSKDSVVSTAELLSEGARVAAARAPSSKDIVKTIASLGTTHRFTSAWTVAKSDAPRDRVTQLERIEWAVRKDDVRLCNEVTPADDVTAGEYRALCVALVMSDPSRCTQTRDLIDLCTEELAAS